MNKRLLQQLKSGLEKPIFGDRDQIEVLQAHEALLNDFKTTGYDRSHYLNDWNFQIIFSCPHCFTVVTMDIPQVAGNPIDLSREAYAECSHCDQSFINSRTGIKFYQPDDEI